MNSDNPLLRNEDKQSKILAEYKIGTNKVRCPEEVVLLVLITVAWTSLVEGAVVITAVSIVMKDGISVWREKCLNQ